MRKKLQMTEGNAAGATDLAHLDNTFARHIRRTLKLAGPVILARVGLFMVITVDVIVLGRFSADELAHYLYGQALTDSLMATLLGLLLGVPVLTARAIGAGEDATVATVWRRGLIYAALVGLGFALILQFAEQLYLAIGQAPGFAGEAGRVTAIVALALPFMAIYFVHTTFLEAVERPAAGMIAAWLANAVNLPLNIVFVFGLGPVPAMGAVGCALATVIVSAGLAFGLGAYVRYAMPDRGRYGLSAKSRDLWKGASTQRQIGYAAGLSFLLEAGAFTVTVLIAGFLGTVGLAAYGVLFQFLALPFTVALGIATATQVRVGNAWGRKDPEGMRRAGLTGLLLAMVFAMAVAAILLADPAFWVGLFSRDPAVIAVAAPVLVWTVAALVTDGGQIVMNNANRGRGDTWLPTSLHLISYWLIMVPLSAWFVFARDLGVRGLFQAIVISSVFSLIALGLRFAWLSWRHPLPPPPAGAR